MHPPTITPTNKAKLPTFLNYQQQFVDYLRNPQTDERLPEILPTRIDVYANSCTAKLTLVCVLVFQSRVNY